jgi:Tol biopolymer transport system component
VRAVVATLAVALVACQGTPQTIAQSAIPNEVGVGTRAAFAIATPAGLIGLDATGKTLGRIATLPKGAVPTAPVLHPGGKQIVFALSQTIEGLGFGSDIYSLNLDGSDLRAVITREGPDVFYASPSFDAAGSFLYVHRRAAKQEANNPGVYLETEDRIERLDLRTGQRQKVLTDGAEPSITPDGKTLVYVRIDRGQQAGLYTIPVDGSNAQPLLKTGDRFWFLQAPRVSPNGRELTWSSAGRSSVLWEEGRVASGNGGRLAHLDIPSELYVAPLDGTSLRSITTTMDDVVPAWSPDGSKIAFIAMGTFFVVSVQDAAVIVKAQTAGFNYGDPLFLH